MAKRDILVVDLVDASNPQHRCGFEQRQAERLLRTDWSGWVLPKDSPYAFVNGYLVKRPKNKPQNNEN